MQNDDTNVLNVYYSKLHWSWPNLKIRTLTSRPLSFCSSLGNRRKCAPQRSPSRIRLYRNHGYLSSHHIFGCTATMDTYWSMTYSAVPQPWILIVPSHIRLYRNHGYLFSHHVFGCTATMDTYCAITYSAVPQPWILIEPSRIRLYRNHGYLSSHHVFGCTATMDTYWSMTYSAVPQPLMSWLTLEWLWVLAQARMTLGPGSS